MNKKYIIALVSLAVLTILQFLPIFYFPYLTSDSYIELWHVDLDKYFRQAIGENRPLRYILVWLFSSITNQNISGLLLVRFINLLIYIGNCYILFFIMQRFIYKSFFFNVLFIVFLNALQGSQLQLAWADLSIHQIVYTAVYCLSYMVLWQLEHKKLSSFKFCLILLAALFTINLIYPVASLNLISLVIGYLLFNYNQSKHLNPTLFLIFSFALALLATFIVGKYFIGFYYESFDKSLLGVYIKTMLTIDLVALTAKILFDSLLFGDTFASNDNRFFIATILFISISFLVIKYNGKLKPVLIRCTLLFTLFALTTIATYLKCGYTLRTVYPVAIAELFFIYYVFQFALKEPLVSNYSSIFKALLLILAFILLISANFSIMRGFIYPKLKEVDFMRYSLVEKDLKKGDEVVVVLPNINNAKIYGSSVGVFEFDFAYNVRYNAKYSYMDYVCVGIGLNASDYKFIFKKLTDEEKIPIELQGKHVIDMRDFAKAELAMAKYIKDGNLRTFLRY